ncbi:MAG TPA: hypothetical protein VF784_01190 [Anaerolineales bacterium]
MPSDPTESLVLLGAAAFLLSTLAEAALRAAWSRAYFTGGLPLVVLRIPVPSHHRNLPSVGRLEAGFGSAWISSLVFREIASNTYAFRTRYFELPLIRVGALMHGMLLFDPDNSQVVMKGFANWDLLCFSIIWPGVFLLPPEFVLFKLAALGFFALVIASVFLFDIPRYTRVAWFAAEAWARRYSPNAARGDAA